MQIHKAKIKREEEIVLSLIVDGEVLNISLSNDDPNEIKAVFNKLILKLKEGIFNFKLEDTDKDLFNYISEEYISQLNNELGLVFQELKDNDLIPETDETDLDF